MEKILVMLYIVRRKAANIDMEVQKSMMAIWLQHNVQIERLLHWKAKSSKSIQCSCWFIVDFRKLNGENSLKEQQLIELRDRIKQIDDAVELSQDNKLMKLLEDKGRKFEEEREGMKEAAQAMANQLGQQIFELQ